MNYVKPRARDLNLGDLAIENVFISEYMTEAEGDFIKVYLLARLYAENGVTVTDDFFARQVGLPQERILEAWDYWEEWGVIKKRYLGAEGRLDFGVEFVNLKEGIYSSDIQVPKDKEQETKVTPVFGNETVSKLMEQIEKRFGRTLSSTELQAVIGWIEDHKATPEVILKALDYCTGRNKVSFPYMGTVIEGWMSQGLNTADLIDEYLEEYDQKFVRYKRVTQALGIPTASEDERRIMDTWFEDMGFTMEKVLEACSKSVGVSNKFKYVNGVLRNWKKNAEKGERDVNDKQPVSNSVLRDYYNYLREKADREAEERRTEVYKVVPRIKEIDDEMRKIGSQMARAYFSGDDKEGSSLHAQLEELNADRAYYLAEQDYDMDYTDPKYTCTTCNDTGIAEMGGPCPDCREQRRTEAEVWQRERELNKEKGNEA